MNPHKKHKITTTPLLSKCSRVRNRRVSRCRRLPLRASVFQTNDKGPESGSKFFHGGADCCLTRGVRRLTSGVRRLTSGERGCREPCSSSRGGHGGHPAERAEPERPTRRRRWRAHHAGLAGISARELAVALRRNQLFPRGQPRGPHPYWRLCQAWRPPSQQSWRRAAAPRGA